MRFVPQLARGKHYAATFCHRGEPMKRKSTPEVVLKPGWVEYLRTSDDDAQAPERSQAGQSRLNHERLINGSGLPFLGRYTDTFTGKVTHRKDYQRLLSDARTGKFSHVAIAFVDRFGRSDIEGLRAFDELIRLGITIRIATYPNLDPAKSDGRMIVGILFNMARFESDRIAERCREGMYTKLQDGGWTWLAPDGYLNMETRTGIEPSERLKHARYKRWIEKDPQQFHVWRTAWDLLLTDRYTLEQICEELHACGYTLRKGRPFITIKGDKRVYAKSVVSRTFHTWFYAGWVTADNEWAKIPPKTVRGHWDPVVTTEEFELGLDILRRRNRDRNHKPRHFYLLQGLLYFENGDGTFTRLTCSTPNANRKRGCTPYYCVPKTKYNFMCRGIDAQIASYMQDITIEPALMPRIRQTYLADVEFFVGKPDASERGMLEKTLKSIDEEELAAARLHAKGKMSEEIWDTLWKSWQDQRTAITATLQAIDMTCEARITSLDHAITLIAKAGILYEEMEPQRQRDLLRHMVKRIVISAEGQIVRVELRSPFNYLYNLAKGDQGAPRNAANRTVSGKSKTSSDVAAGSNFVSVGAPRGI
jgi:DNA invertase Pin-like site-specific DNA recombinase